jgi:hypothetical protein
VLNYAARLTVPAMLRWLIGAPLAVVSGVGTVLIPTYQMRYGWERDTSLIWVIYAWVFVGSFLFLLRREAGRRILRGASTAFGVFLAIVVLTPPFESPVPYRFYCAVIIAVCVVIGVILSLRQVRMGMREASQVD